MDGRGFELWGLAWSDVVTFDELSAHIHPASRDRVRSALVATRAVLGPYETDFRILVGEEVRWVSTRGQDDDAGIVGRTMFGIFLDVSGRKHAEEGNELLAGKMSHRVKNLLAIAAVFQSGRAYRPYLERSAPIRYVPAWSLPVQVFQGGAVEKRPG